LVDSSVVNAIRVLVCSKPGAHDGYPEVRCVAVYEGKKDKDNPKTGHETPRLRADLQLVSFFDLGARCG
jgi:hypothetical protein